MADIFISYSSKDREKAEQLTERLVSAGLSVWIDNQGIDAATSWSEEIVDAIDNCSIVIVILSASSIASHNVIKEVSLASEKQKKILPLDLEPVEIPKSLQYHLAGIQRAPMTNIDSIIRALGKLGLVATKVPTVASVTETDSRKSLMILPFEDLSPTGDNGWFADGIVSELISALSYVQSLRLADVSRTKEYKNFKGHLSVYAKEMGIRYFVQGDVRKFGDNIKITSRLLDIETGDHLWQDSLKGTMNEIFLIQETVAKNVTAGLNIILTNAEQKELDKKPTENIEAYELWLRGLSYIHRYLLDDYHRALSLFEEASKLDPNFADAFSGIVATCQNIYRSYDRNPRWLAKAEAATENIKRIQGRSRQYLWAESSNALLRGDALSALAFAKEVVTLDPSFFLGYDALGYAYKALGKKEEMVEAWEEQIRLQDNITGRFTLLVALNELGDHDRLCEAAKSAIPVYERHIRLNPDDYFAQVQLATILPFAGKMSRAIELADALASRESLDSVAIYNLACLYMHCDEHAKGLATLRKAMAKGFKAIETLRRDPDLDPLREMPEFKTLLTDLEAKIEQESNA